MDEEEELGGANPTLLMLFDYREGKWVLVFNQVVEVTGADCPPEVKAEWEEQMGYPMPDDEKLRANQASGCKFDSIEEMQAWLTLNLHKCHGWMIGLVEDPPAEEFEVPQVTEERTWK